MSVVPIDPAFGAHARTAVPRSTIRKNLVAVGLSYGLGAVFGFVAQAVVARTLGRATFGTFVAATSLVTIVAVIDQLGNNEYIVREAARRPERLGDLIGDALFLHLFTTCGLVAAAVAIAVPLHLSGASLPLVLLLAVMAGVNGASQAIRSGLKSVERLEIAAAISVVLAAGSAAGIILAMRSGWGLRWAVGLSLAVSVVGVPASWMLVRPHVRIRARASAKAARAMIRGGVPFAAVGVLSSAIVFSDSLVVHSILGDRATGLYGAAFRLIIALGFIPLVFENSVYRTLAHTVHHARDRFAPFVERSAGGLFLLALPLAAGGVFLGRRVLVLVFGASYAGGATAFRVLLWSLPFSFPALLLTSAVIVGDRPHPAGWLLGAGFAMNLTANIVFDGRFGIAAAAAITTATMVFIAAGATVVLARRGDHVRWMRWCAPGVIAAAVMTLAVLPLRRFPLAVPVIAGGLVYFAVLLAMGAHRRFGER